MAGYTEGVKFGECAANIRRFFSARRIMLTAYLPSKPLEFLARGVVLACSQLFQLSAKLAKLFPIHSTTCNITVSIRLNRRACRQVGLFGRIQTQRVSTRLKRENIGTFREGRPNRLFLG